MVKMVSLLLKTARRETLLDFSHVKQQWIIVSPLLQGFFLLYVNICWNILTVIILIPGSSAITPIKKVTNIKLVGTCQLCNNI